MAKKLSTDLTLGVRDAAARLNRSVQRIKQFASEGRIGKMIAGRYLFSESELAEFAKIPRQSGRQKQPEK